MSLTVGSRCQVWHSNSRQSFWRGSIFFLSSLLSAFSSVEGVAAEVDDGGVVSVDALGVDDVLESPVSLMEALMLKMLTSNVATNYKLNTKFLKNGHGFESSQQK